MLGANGRLQGCLVDTSAALSDSLFTPARQVSFQLHDDDSEKGDDALKKGAVSSWTIKSKLSQDENIPLDRPLSSQDVTLDMAAVERQRENQLMNEMYKTLQDFLPKLEACMDPQATLVPATSHIALCMKTAFPLLKHLSMAIAQDMPDILGQYSPTHSTTSSSFSPSAATLRKRRRDRAETANSNHSLIYDSICSAPSGDDLETQPPSKQESPSAVSVRRISLSELPRTIQADALELRSIHSMGEVFSSANKIYLHPESVFRLSWDAISLSLILIMSVVIPIELGFFLDTPAPSFVGVISLVVDIFFSIDIILNFFTAYHDGHGISGQLVTHLHGIGRHYIRGWFVIDLLATFPYEMAVKAFSGDSEDASGAEAAGILRLLKYAKVARVMKVLRLLKLGGLMQIVEEKMVAAQSMTVAFQLFKMTTLMFILSHNIACGWYALAAQVNGPTWFSAAGLDKEQGGFRHYIAAYYFAITTGTTVGYGDIHPVSTMEQAVTAVLLLVSVAYVGQFLGRVSQMIISLRHNENMLEQTKRDALVFMISRQVDRKLQYKVLRYIDHSFENHSLTSLDSQIMENLSESLRNELALAITGRVYRNFPLFEDVEDDFLTALCAVGRTKRAGIGDVIVTEEHAAHDMFWVVRGEATVRRHGVLLNMLRPNDWFGELTLFFPGAVRTATVRCETHCEFLVLSYENFREQMREFPHVKKEYDALVKELKRGDARGLKLRCLSCGSKDHLTKDCLVHPIELTR